MSVLARRHLRRGLILADCLIASLAFIGIPGCAMRERHAEKKIPCVGVVDPNQPRELEKVSMPSYVVEPPDELEITVRPNLFEQRIPNVIVRSDGMIDLGFYGDVYVAGLTLEDIERKVANHMQPLAKGLKPAQPLEVSVRLVSSTQSKVYYVIGTVNVQGKFPITGNETVLDGILQAGLRVNSLPDKAYLARPRPAGGPDQVLRIEWERIKAGDTLTNYQLLPGDRIVVPGTKAPGLLSSLLGR